MKTQLMAYFQFNAKLTTILLVSFLTFLKEMFLEYVFDDLRFLVGISLLMITDTLSGIAVAMIKGEFNLPLLFKKIIIKIASYALFIKGVSLLLKLKVGGKYGNFGYGS